MLSMVKATGVDALESGDVTPVLESNVSPVHKRPKDDKSKIVQTQDDDTEDMDVDEQKQNDSDAESMDVESPGGYIDALAITPVLEHRIMTVDEEIDFQKEEWKPMAAHFQRLPSFVNMKKLPTKNTVRNLLAMAEIEEEAETDEQ